MTTNEQNGHLVASRIEVEPTDRQRAAHKLVEAFGIAGEIDWTAVEANFRLLTETAGYDSPVSATGRAAASRVNESLLAGQEPFQADLDAVRYALEQTRSAKPLELVDGIPARYWQGWLVEKLASSDLCRDAHGGRWCREVPTRTPTRLVPEWGRALAWRGRADAGERGRLRIGL